MSAHTVDEKCYYLMASVLGAKKSRALCNAIWNIGKPGDARRLRPLLQCQESKPWT